MPQGSRSQACRVGRAAPSGSAPGSRLSRRPAVPLGWPEPQRDTPWGSDASRRAVRPQSRFRLPEVSAFPHPRCSKPVRTAERLARVQPGTGARRAARSRGGLRHRSRASLCLPGASLVPRCRAAFPAPSHPLCWVLPERFVSNACVNWRSAEVSLCGQCLAFAGRLMHSRTSRPPPAALRVFAVRERRPGSERVSARPGLLCGTKSTWRPAPARLPGSAGGCSSPGAVSGCRTRTRALCLRSCTVAHCSVCDIKFFTGHRPRSPDHGLIRHARPGRSMLPSPPGLLWSFCKPLAFAERLPHPHLHPAGHKP